MAINTQNNSKVGALPTSPTESFRKRERNMKKITQDQINLMQSGTISKMWAKLQYSDQRSPFAQAYHRNLQSMTSWEAIVNAHEETNNT